MGPELRTRVLRQKLLVYKLEKLNYQSLCDVKSRDKVRQLLNLHSKNSLILNALVNQIQNTNISSNLFKQELTQHLQTSNIDINHLQTKLKENYRRL